MPDFSIISGLEYSKKFSLKTLAKFAISFRKNSI